MQEESISHFKIKSRGKQERAWNAILDFLRNELVDKLYHHNSYWHSPLPSASRPCCSTHAAWKVVHFVTSSMRLLTCRGCSWLPVSSREKCIVCSLLWVKGAKEMKVMRHQCSSWDLMHCKAGEEIEALQDMRTNLSLANPCYFLLLKVWHVLL